MTVAVVGNAHQNSGTAGVLGMAALALPAGSAAGHLCIAAAVNERGSITATQSFGSAGYQSAYTIGSTNLGIEVGWKRLTTADLAAGVAVSTTGSRRMAQGLIVLSGAGDPVFTNTALGTLTPGGTTTATFPAVVPAAADSMLIGVIGATPVGVNWTRTWTVNGTPSGWTKDLDDTSATAGGGQNGWITFIHRLVSGGAATSQPGAVLNPSDLATTGIVDYMSVAVVRPYSATAIPAGWDEFRLFYKA